MLTYNQVIQRLQVITNAHKQLRMFYRDDKVDALFNEKTTVYPCLCTTDTPGASIIDPIGKTATYAFTLFIVDLVHAGKERNANQQDVQSDMFLIAADIISEIDYSGYSDWKITSGVPVTFVYDELNEDVVAGVMLQISIQTPYNKDICAVPANSFTFPIIDTNMKYVNDIVYLATGDEGSTITIPEITGKNILLLVRETFTQFETTAFDGYQTTQYLWSASDDPLVNINLGKPVTAGERFLILYRNF